MALSPEQAATRARPGSDVIGWKLDPDQRKHLLELLAPRYANPVADHVTLKAKVSANAALPHNVTAAIVGHADDCQGVEAMVVAIGGSSARPGGGTYHITWSLGPGRKAKESNDVLAQGSWARFEQPIPITLLPARFR